MLPSQNAAITFPEPDFHRDPFLVIWEVTRACHLACRHCRARARRYRDPGELTTGEGLGLLDQISSFRNPLLVVTGGDPLWRDDLFVLMEAAHRKGLRVTFTPSATPLLTPEAIRRARQPGARRMALSLDGSIAKRHDAFRGVPGSFRRTREAIEAARETGLPVQINTSLTRQTFEDLRGIGELVRTLQPALWAIFFLIPTGRGRIRDLVPPEIIESILHWLYDYSRTAGFPIKTTAAPHFRRVATQRLLQDRRRGNGKTEIPDKRFFTKGTSADGIRLSRLAVNDGNGLCFISHTGEVYPSGFLPVSAGNVREKSLVEIYRNAPIFKQLRDVSLLRGRCGICPFKKICGGSRARAFATTGDYLMDDPACAYQPDCWNPTPSGDAKGVGIYSKITDPERHRSGG